MFSRPVPGFDGLMHAVLNADPQIIRTWSRTDRLEWRIAEEGWTERHARTVMVAERLLGSAATAGEMRAQADAAMAGDSGDRSRRRHVAALIAAGDAIDAEEFRATRERQLIRNGWDEIGARQWARAEMAMVEAGHDLMTPVTPADVLAHLSNLTARLTAGAPDRRRRTPSGALAGWAELDLRQCQADLPLLCQGLAALNREVSRRIRTA